MRTTSRKMLSALALAVLLSLVLFSTALAISRAINTNDGVVDPDWSAIPFTSDTVGDGPGAGDIVNVWVSSNTPTSELAFRMQVNAMLSQSYMIYARVDCDGDGLTYNDPDDRTVFYHPQTDAMYEASGDGVLLDVVHRDYGESISLNTNFEWKVVLNDNGFVGWSACASQPYVLFEITNFLGTVVDDTVARAFDVPTAVTVKQIEARPQQHPLGAFLLLIGGVFAGAGVLALRRRMRA
jgi:hypothetical protein